MINQVLGGIFIKKTVKEYIEGYKVELLEGVSKKNVEEGGDPTVSPMMSILDSPLDVPNMTQALFVGGDERPDLTRSYAMYNMQDKLRVGKPGPVNIREFKTTQINPWAEDVSLKGTDAGQFHPVIKDTKEKLNAFVSDLVRTLKMEYTGKAKHHGLPVYKYEIDSDQMKGADQYEDNRKYYQYWSGTVNMSSVLGLPMIATKGKYMDIGPEVQERRVALVDANGKDAVPDRDIDDVGFLIEPNTGSAVKASQRL